MNQCYLAKNSIELDRSHSEFILRWTLIRYAGCDVDLFRILSWTQLRRS